MFTRKKKPAAIASNHAYNADMQPSTQSVGSRSSSPIVLVIFVVVLAGVMVWSRPARILVLVVLAFSIPIGVIVALILRYWHQRRPVKVEDDRPLKLDLD